MIRSGRIRSAFETSSAMPIGDSRPACPSKAHVRVGNTTLSCRQAIRSSPGCSARATAELALPARCSGDQDVRARATASATYPRCGVRAPSGSTSSCPTNGIDNERMRRSRGAPTGAITAFLGLPSLMRASTHGRSSLRSRLTPSRSGREPRSTCAATRSHVRALSAPRADLYVAALSRAQRSPGIVAELWRDKAERSSAIDATHCR